MADATTTTGPSTTPGNQTSEFALTKYLTIFGSVLTALGTILATVQSVLPNGSKPAIYVGIAIAVIGALMKVATVLGYSSGRADQKVALIEQQGAIEAAKVQAAAAKSPEAATAAING